MATPGRIRDECVYFFHHPRIFLNEVLCGITMAIVVIPESISFSYMAGMNPIQGLYATFFLGFIAAALGSRPAVISGCSGALCVITKAITSETGPLGGYEYATRTDALLLTMIFSGVFQILFGMLKLGQLIKLLPQSAMVGFVNGLAIIIFLSQLPSFQICEPPVGDTTEYMFKDCPEEFIHYIRLSDLDSWLTLICLAICTASIFLFPKIPVVGKFVPASLIAMLIGSAFEHGIVRAALGRETRILKTTAPINGGWPQWHIPSLPEDGTVWGVVLLYGVYTAVVADVESVMTVTAISEVLDERVQDSDLNQECVAQGVGNFVSGFFGAIGGNAMIGESNLNIISGARHRLSAMVMGWVVLFIVVWLSPVVNLVPLASLTAVILSITVHTFYWPCLWTMHRMRKSDVIIIIVTTLLAVFTNLGIAVGVGFLIAAVNLTWDAYNMLKVTSYFESIRVAFPRTNLNFQPKTTLDSVALSNNLDETTSPNSPLSDVSTTSSTASTTPLNVRTFSGEDSKINFVANSLNTYEAKVYEIEGPIFFGSSRSVSNFFTPSTDPQYVIVDLEESSLSDLSAVTAICTLISRYQSAGKFFILRNLSRKSRRQCLRSRDFVKNMRRTAYSSYRSLSIEEVLEEERKKGNSIQQFFCADAVDTNSDGDTDADIEPPSNPSINIRLGIIEENDRDHTSIQKSTKRDDVAVELSESQAENEHQALDNSEFDSSTELRVRSTLSQKGTKRLQHLDMLKPGLYDEHNSHNEEHEQ